MFAPTGGETGEVEGGSCRTLGIFRKDRWVHRVSDVKRTIIGIWQEEDASREGRRRGQIRLRNKAGGGPALTDYRTSAAFRRDGANLSREQNRWRGSAAVSSFATMRRAARAFSPTYLPVFALPCSVHKGCRIRSAIPSSIKLRSFKAFLISYSVSRLLGQCRSSRMKELRPDNLFGLFSFLFWPKGCPIFANYRVIKTHGQGKE